MPPAAAPVSPAAARTMGVAVGLFLVAVALLWLSGPESAAPRAMSSGPVRDPLAARRPAAASAAANPSPAAAVVPQDPAFLLSPTLPDDPRGDDDAALLERYRATLEHDPANADALYDSGRVLLRMGRAAESLGPLRRATEIRPGQWPQVFTFAYACARAERWPEAVSAFQRAKALLSSDAATSYNLALAEQKAGDYVGAAREYAEAIALDPLAPSARLGLAISLDRQGRAGDARVAYQETLRLIPSGPQADTIGNRVRQLEGSTAP